MAYRILKKNKEAGLNSLYMYITEPVDGVMYYKEFDTKEEVDKYVEEQLNAGVPKTFLEIVAPMKYTVSASIEDEECGCGIPSTNPKPALIPYKIIANPVGGIVERGVKITFIIDADRAKFQRLIIDGAEVKSDYYTVTAGSTIVSLVGIYADTLALGEHTIEFIFSDGKAEDKFEIVEKSEGGEETPGGSDDTPSDTPTEDPSDEPGDTPGESDEPDDEEPSEPETPSEDEEPETPSGDGDEETPSEGDIGEGEPSEGTTDEENTPSEGSEEGSGSDDSTTEPTIPTTPSDLEDATDSDDEDEEPEEATTDDVIIPGFDGL